VFRGVGEGVFFGTEHCFLVREKTRLLLVEQFQNALESGRESQILLRVFSFEEQVFFGDCP
jgi:hypothetical protein